MKLKDVFKAPPMTVSSGMGKSQVKFKKLKIKAFKKPKVK